MIRIVGIERNPDPTREFILLQNQGNLRQTLRGYAVVPEALCDAVPGQTAMHIFADEVHVAPGVFIMLRTGSGQARWTQTRDGARVYNVYMERSEPVWNEVQGPIHVLCIQHTYVERTTPALTLR